MADNLELREQIVETGKMLLAMELVARTWGNVSARIDEEHFAISPSGLDYLQTTPEDIAIVRLEDMSWEGPRKPSSEKGVHAAAYECFDDVNFVIHTHQKFATALGLGGFMNHRMTEEERELLGTVMTAEYGLPGTEKLKNNVVEKFEEGSKVVFMKNHGVVICGKDRDDAFKKAVMLEEVCRKQIRGMNVDEPAARQYAILGIPLVAQLDDMAQMIGKTIPVVSKRNFSKIKNMNKPALIVEGKGIVVYAPEKDDEEALKILTEKAAVSALHTRAIGEEALLSDFDVHLMRTVYIKKYSKQKKG